MGKWEKTNRCRMAQCIGKFQGKRVMDKKKMQEKIKKVAKKSIRFFVYMAAGVFFSAFSFVVSGMASYDYLLQDEMTTELVLVMLLYFLVPIFFSDMLYDFCYQRGRIPFSWLRFISRRVTNLLLWFSLNVSMFDEKYKVYTATWVVISYIILSYQDSKHTGRVNRFVSWLRAASGTGIGFKTTIAPMLTLSAAACVFTIDLIQFWMMSPFFVWWVNRSIIISTESRAEKVAEIKKALAS